MSHHGMLASLYLEYIDSSSSDSDSSLLQFCKQDEWKYRLDKNNRNEMSKKICSHITSKVSKGQKKKTNDAVFQKFAQKVEDTYFLVAQSQEDYYRMLAEHIVRLDKDGIPPCLKIMMQEAEMYESEADDGKKKPDDLIDLAASVVGQQYSCTQIEESHIKDDSMLKKIAMNAFPNDEADILCLAGLESSREELERGELLLLCETKINVQQIGFMTTVDFIDESCQVSVTFEKGKITSSKCSKKCSRTHWCRHVIAAVLYRIRSPKEVEVFAPMMESLSDLSKEQLQKLVHYAVEDEPSLLNNIFKRYREVRDINSDIGMAHGAPDRTLLGIADMDGQDISSSVLNNLSESFTLILTDREFSYSQNYKQKEKSVVYQHMEHLIKLGKQCLYDEATELLKKMLDIILSSDCAYASVPFATFCQDLERLICAFLVHPKLSCQAREALGQMIQQQARFASEIELTLNKEGICWHASLPSCVCLSPDRDVPFLREASTMAFTGPWPQELLRVIELPWQETSYVYCQEKITVSMHRLEALTRFGSYSHTDGISLHHHLQDARLGFWLLLQLFRYSKVDFILMQYINSSEDESVKHSLHKINWLLNEKTLAPSDEPPKKKLKWKKYGEQSHGLHTIAKSQQIYLALQIVDEIIKAMDACTAVKLEFESIMPWFCLLTLEFSRSWTSEKKVLKTEKEHFIDLQTSIVAYLKKEKHLIDQCQMYFEALCSCGLVHYKNCLPLVLMVTLLSLYRKFPKDRKGVKPTIVLQVCSMFITNSDQPTATYFPETQLDKPALLQHKPNQYSMNTVANFALSEFYSITAAMLEFFDESNEEHILVIERTLQSLWCCCIDSVLLHIVVLAFQDRQYVLSNADQQKIRYVEKLLYNVVISCLKQSQTENIDKVCLSENFFISLLQKEGFTEKAVSEVIQLWHLVLDAHGLDLLLSKIKKHSEEGELGVSEKDMLTSSTETIALDCIKRIINSGDMYGRGNLSEYFDETKPTYLIARDLVLSHPDKFWYSALLQWACKELRTNNATVSEHVFTFLRETLRQMREEMAFDLNSLNGDDREDLKKLFETCASKWLSDSSPNGYSEKLIEITTESCDDHPDIILILLDVLSGDENSQVTGIQTLKKKLLSNYLEHFDDMLRMQTRNSYKYDQFVKSLQTACKNYVERTKEDAKSFIDTVVNGLKQRHSAKRKLCYMLTNVFQC